MPAQRTALACPVCGDATTLEPRIVGEGDEAFGGLGCPNCDGQWLDHEAVCGWATPLEDAGREAPERNAQLQRSGVRTKQEGPFYRHCIHCGAMMQRDNYGKRSDVIVDVCLRHGIWFDRGELDAIAAWLGSGGAVRSATHDEKQAEQDERDRKHLEAMRMPRYVYNEDTGRYERHEWLKW